MYAKTIYFVRHGQTDWNAVARMQGRANSSLNETGRRQAEVHGRFLAGCDIQAIHASPLDRVRQTAAIVQRFVDREPSYDERIMEWDCGDWSGHLRTEVAERWPAEWAALAADPYNFRGPGCENYPDMMARARPFVAELVASVHERIAVLSHGMIGRVMVGMLAGFDETGMLSFKQPNDVIYRVRLPAPASPVKVPAQVRDQPGLSADGAGPAIASPAAVVDYFEAGLGPHAGLVPHA